MRVTLKEMEKETLAQGREWTRQRLEQRLQEEADFIAAVCPQSGLVLKRQQRTSFTLMTVAGSVTVKATRGYSTATQSWVCPVREHWGLAKWQRLSPEFEERLAYSATQVGSFEKAAAMSGCWGSPISDDALHALVQRSAARSREIGLPPPPPPKTQQPPYSLVVMLDGWMARERGEAWGLPPAPSPQERVAWREVKSAVVYRVEDRAENASGRGMLIEKKVVAVAPGTDVVDFGAMVQEQAMRCGLAAAREVFVVADGALWIWRLIEDRFATATKTLDFYHGAEHLWTLAHHLHPGVAEKAKAWIQPLLHQLRHEAGHRVIDTLEKLLLDNASTHAADPDLEREVQYFLAHRDHLDYAGVAARSAPIGSGSMESACSQFQDRLKRRGQFWSPQGLANMLALDVIAKNNALSYLWN